MRQCFCFLIVLISGSELPPCENQVLYLNESWSSWDLLPPGSFSLNTACSYTLVYPNDTALCGLFYSREQWDSLSVETIGGVDAFGTAVSLDEYQAITCLPPPWYSIFLPSRAESFDADFTFNSMDGYCKTHNCTKFRLLQVDPFKHNETVPVTPGMEPFVIMANSQIAKRTTYNFTGYPLVSVVYIKATNKFYSYEKTPLDAGSFFIYNELGQIIGTPASWQGGVQQFPQLIVHEMGPGFVNTEEADRPGLLAVMSTVDLDGLVNPKFIQPYYESVSVDATHGQTSVTIVDADSYSSYCIQYSLKYFTFTNDVEILVYDGFPKQNLTEDMAVYRLNATNLNSDFIMVLGCTKTLYVLQGSVTFQMDTMYGHGTANYLFDKKTVKGFIKTEKMALKKMSPQRVEVAFPCNLSYDESEKRCNFSTHFTWGDDSPADAKLRLSQFNGRVQNDVFYPPNSVDFESIDQYMLTVYLTGGSVEFEVTEPDQK